MNTQKRQVSFLESFPPDIWAHFAWYLPGEQLGRLVMTGATFVSQRLRSPNVVRSIKLGQDFLFFKSFPRFLSAFPSVEELSFHSCGFDWSYELGLRLDLIPSGLKKLEFTGLWGNILPVFGPTLNLSQVLPYLETLHLMNVPLHDFSWMTHAPQTLTSLSLHTWTGTPGLPDSLLHFEAHAVELSTSSFIPKLPHSLESFVVTEALLGAELLLPLLPPSITTLNVGYRIELSGDPTATQNFLDLLPRSLTRVRVPASGTNFNANPELASLLPSTLTELEIIPPFPCSAWHFLPPQIKNLSFRAPGYLCTVISNIRDNQGVHHQMKSIPFGSLPRCITKLELCGVDIPYFCGPPTSSNQLYFPPQLTHLKLSKVQLAPETTKLLPPSLTYLKVANLCERVCEHPPKGLKTLISNSLLMSPKLLKFLPQSLTFFKVCIASDDSEWFDFNTGKAFERFSEHPQYKIHEQCLSPSFSWKSQLPPTLKYFKFHSAGQLRDSFLEHHQLSNLLELNLPDSEFFTDFSIPLLSSHLTILDLASSSQISGKSFQFLPRCLTELTLNRSESIFDSDIQHLPRILKRISFNRAIHLTDLCIPHLPPHLEELKMLGNRQITPSCFPNLPYAMRRHQANGKIAEFAGWFLRWGTITLV